MGPDFLDRPSFWYMFCCNFISLLFLIQNIFSRGISGYPAGYRISKRPDIRCNTSCLPCAYCSDWAKAVKDILD